MRPLTHCSEVDQGLLVALQALIKLRLRRPISVLGYFVYFIEPGACPFRQEATSDTTHNKIRRRGGGELPLGEPYVYEIGDGEHKNVK